MRNNDKTIKEIWHIPKRSSIHQAVGALTIICDLGLEGHGWSRGARKKFNQSLGTWGFTNKKTSLSDTARETLEAFLKYLGLMYVSSDKPIHITKAGHKLLHEISYKKPTKIRALEETIKSMGDIKPDIIKTQLLKLVITNPVVRGYCSGVFIAPFRETLRLILSTNIQELSREEIAMFLFKMKSENERDSVKQQILDFRKLTPTDQQRVIKDYSETYIGNKTLGESSATVKYWVGICKIAGWFDEKYTGLRFIKSINKEEIPKLIRKYEKFPIYNFDDYIGLWLEYYGDPDVVDMPKDVQFKLSEYAENLLLTIRDKGRIIHASLFKESVSAPLFIARTYNIEILDLNKNGESVYSDKFIYAGENQLSFKLGTRPSEQKTSFKAIEEKINEMIKSSTGFDHSYFNKLQVLNKVLNLGFDLDNSKKRMSYYRGGRLECLVFELLQLLEQQGLINHLKWYGRYVKYGICTPAPGGKRGNPDITFKVTNTHFVLELTTIPGVRAQWAGSEASSVPDHILNHKEKENIEGEVIGIFVAPSIEPQLEKNLKRHVEEEGTSIITLPLGEFIQVIGLAKSSSDLEKGLRKFS